MQNVAQRTRGKEERGSQRSFLPNAERLFKYMFSSGLEHENVLHGRCTIGEKELTPL